MIPFQSIHWFGASVYVTKLIFILYFPGLSVLYLTLNFNTFELTHLPLVQHICVDKLTIISSDNGLSLIRRQVIIWTNAKLLSLNTHRNKRQWNFNRNVKLFIHCVNMSLGVVPVMYVHNEKHYDVIKWKQFPRYWPFVRGIHRSPMDSHHKGQWRGALVFPLSLV